MAAAAAAAGDTPKWEGKVTANLLTSTAEEVWPLLADFCAVHKLFPTLDTCHKVDGVEGQLVRYCAGGLRWCHEKLLAIDPVDKWLTYEILDNNMGLKAYKATMKVVPLINGGDQPSGCRIEWSFVADPVDSFGYEDFCGYLDLNAQAMVKNIEKELGLSS